MAFLPWFRVAIFSIIILLSPVVLGFCVYFLFLSFQCAGINVPPAPLGIGVASLSTIFLLLFLILGSIRHRVFTSTILFEVFWFSLLWILWLATAIDFLLSQVVYDPFDFGCNDYYSALFDTFATEYIVVLSLAFVNFFFAFLYFFVILLYAIINAIRGRRIWTASVNSAANSGTTTSQLPFNAAPTTQILIYGGPPGNLPPTQLYGTYPQQVTPQGAPAQVYVGYPQQAPPEGSPQQYYAYPGQVLPDGAPAFPPGQNLVYIYAHPPGSPQQQVNYAGYAPSPATNATTLSSQPNSSPHHVHVSHAPPSPPGGYQGQPIIQ